MKAQKPFVIVAAACLRSTSGGPSTAQKSSLAIAHPAGLPSPTGRDPAAALQRPGRTRRTISGPLAEATGQH